MGYDQLRFCSMGDLVVCIERGDKIWEVTGYKHEINSKGMSLVKYTLISTSSYDIIEEFQDNIILVCKKDFAVEYIKVLKESGMPPVIPTKSKSKSKSKGIVYATPARKPTKKEEYEMIDDLLDRYNQIQRFIEIDGKITEESQLALDIVLEELSKLTSKQTPSKAERV